MPRFGVFRSREAVNQYGPRSVAAKAYARLRSSSLINHSLPEKNYSVCILVHKTSLGLSTIQGRLAIYRLMLCLDFKIEIFNINLILRTI